MKHTMIVEVVDQYGNVIQFTESLTWFWLNARIKKDEERLAIAGFFVAEMPLPN